jgi:Cys-tRNA(Pro)/Cys-tRNA(Cys) deacylase
VFIKPLLDNKIESQIREYPREIRDTTLVAQHIKVPPNQLFKGLVVIEKNINPLLVMIPSNSHLDINQLKSTLGAKELRFATIEQAEKFTGMQVGGISPLGLLDKNIPIYIDKIVTEYKWIVISAGQRGISVRVPVIELVNLIQAQFLSV